MKLLSYTVLLSFSLLTIHFSVWAARYNAEDSEGKRHYQAQRKYNAGLIPADDQRKDRSDGRKNMPNDDTGLHRISSFRDLTLLAHGTPPAEAFFPATLYIHYTPQRVEKRAG